MARKGKGKKKPKVTCPGCGSRMAKRDVACRRCGAARAGYFRPGQPGTAKALFQPFGAQAFVVKSAKPGRPLTLVKPAGPQLRDELMAEWRGSPHPESREGAWQALFGEHLGGGAAS